MSESETYFILKECLQRIEACRKKIYIAALEYQANGEFMNFDQHFDWTYKNIENVSQLDKYKRVIALFDVGKFPEGVEIFKS